MYGNQSYHSIKPFKKASVLGVSSSPMSSSSDVVTLVAMEYI